MSTEPKLTVQQLIDYGARLAQENQPDKARPFFEKALQRDPRQVDAWLWLAAVSPHNEGAWAKNRRAHLLLK